MKKPSSVWKWLLCRHKSSCISNELFKPSANLVIIQPFVLRGVGYNKKVEEFHSLVSLFVVFLSHKRHLLGGIEEKYETTANCCEYWIYKKCPTQWCNSNLRKSNRKHQQQKPTQESREKQPESWIKWTLLLYTITFDRDKQYSTEHSHKVWRQTS